MKQNELLAEKVEVLNALKMKLPKLLAEKIDESGMIRKDICALLLEKTGVTVAESAIGMYISFARGLKPEKVLLIFNVLGYTIKFTDPVAVEIVKVETEHNEEAVSTEALTSQDIQSGA